MALSNATRLSDFGSGIGTAGAVIQVDNSNSRLGVGTTAPSQTLDVAGIITARTGFNIGINSGKEAGQSIMHCHIHLIPRREGDVENPQGGVRGVIPSKQHYVRKSK